MNGSEPLISEKAGNPMEQGIVVAPIVKSVLKRLDSRPKLHELAKEIFQGIRNTLSFSQSKEEMFVGELDTGSVCGKNPDAQFTCAVLPFTKVCGSFMFFCEGEYDWCAIWEFQCDDNSFECDAKVFECYDFSCPDEETTYTCEEEDYFGCVGPDFNCGENASFKCSGEGAFLCMDTHDCMGDHLCNGESGFTCGFPLPGTDDFDCNDFHCESKTNFTCETTTSFDCEGSSSMGFSCTSNDAFDCAGNFDCDDNFSCTGDFVCDDGYDCPDNFECNPGLTFTCFGGDGFNCMSTFSSGC